MFTRYVLRYLWHYGINGLKAHWADLQAGRIARQEFKDFIRYI